MRRKEQIVKSDTPRRAKRRSSKKLRQVLDQEAREREQDEIDELLEMERRHVAWANKNAEPDHP